ncbi:MAG TPA: PEP-CTERM sorting domain-containing protein [Steroidobacteraceae bacterium]|jgi:hypothetical protein|nr:PEP-CTERM sorting domain-containing protein [Steroidobacteraceae bacterium]
MRSVRACVVLAIPLLGLAAVASAQTITDGTGASEVVSFGTVSQSGGPFPWSDLGITANANVTPGTLNVQTGGSTAFKLTTTFTAGEVLTAGDPFNVGYNPGWTGQFNSAPAASGGFSSQFVYNLGPFSGSETILNVPLSVPGATTGHLSSSLNTPIISPPVSVSQSIGGPGVSLTATLKAQGCFFVCVTVASASLGFNVGTQIQQSIVAQPLITYGDIVWESTTPTYSASDHPTFVPGFSGSVMNTLAAPSGLTTGDTFYFNVLPAIQLNMPVIDTADVAVPASITASWDIFGAGGSETWPLGDLYELGGAGAFDFNPEFYGSEFYSLPLIYTSAYCAQIACFPAKYTVPGSGSGNPVNTPTGGGVPGDNGPCGADTLVTCGLTVTPTPGNDTGYGNTPTNPLFPPGDCGPAGALGPDGYPWSDYCYNNDLPPTLQTSQTVPEPDALALLALGSLGVFLQSRRRPRVSR